MEWAKTCKQYQDTQMEHKKARQAFHTRDTAFKKAREQAVKQEHIANASPGGPGTLEATRRKKEVERRRKIEEDAQIKRTDAFNNWQRLEQELDVRLGEMENAKIRIVADLRELVYQCDQTTKACSLHYFQALAQLWVAQPAKYQDLAETARAYVPGAEYMSFLQHLPGRSASSSSLLR
uniref:GMIP/FCHO2-like FCH domain-containing protein n=2 Tax=Plectus sambesii TaxID=2011161 RepID=A0A914WSX7_9BILA